jgi:alpha-D-xyloside xylohydrolase
MLPYIYTMYYKLHAAGIPIARPLIMDYPGDATVQNRAQEYLFGDGVLVSPVVAKSVTSQVVYLPAGMWYDFWTGDTVTGGRMITRAVTPEILPVYVKAGTILPLGKVMNHTGELANDTIELRVYKGNDSHFDLYEDDGETYPYETGRSSLIPIDWNNAASMLNIAPRVGTFPGMLGKRVFNLVVVRPNHGTGGGVTQTPDSVINYSDPNSSVRQSSLTLNANEPSGAVLRMGRREIVVAAAEQTQMVEIIGIDGALVRKVVVPRATTGHIATGDIGRGLYLVKVSDGIAIRSYKCMIK